jgi:hypothetical protein
MGHYRLQGPLPDTRPWRKVVGALAGGGDVSLVAITTSQAAQLGLDLADGDEGLKQTFWLLSQVVLAARQEDFRSALKDVGVIVPSEPSALNIVAGFTDAIDNHLRKTRARTDIGEMAQMAGAEAITSTLSSRLTNLFDTTHVEVKEAVRECSTKAGFAYLAHDFFARFTQRFLTYHLSRELANHVGEGKRFASPSEHTEFIDQLGVHCRQTALIVKQFAGDWHSKTNFEGGITPTKAKNFLHVALDKLRRELKVREERDG